MKIIPKTMIVGTGVGLPDKVLTNLDLEKIVDTTDEWIKTRTGIEERRIAVAGELTSDLCAKAALNALHDAHISPEEVDVIILATISGDMAFPSTACFVQQKIGASNAAAYDIQAACAGFLYALDLADSYITMGKARTVLAIGGEILTRLTDYNDRATCVLFGDGAGAAVLRPSDGERGIYGTLIKSDGRLHNLLYCPGLGTANPPTHENIDLGFHYIKMEGREVFKHAVTCMGNAAEEILQRARWTNQDVDWLIPHQANQRIIDATAKRIQLPAEKVFINLNRFGNTSAASIPIALHEAKSEGKLRSGQNFVLVAFGAGFTWGAAAIKF